MLRNPVYAGKRIIPTRMGTRKERAVIYRSFQDHPHAYGDKGLFDLEETYDRGSSPRVWGQGKIILKVKEN